MEHKLIGVEKKVTSLNVEISEEKLHVHEEKNKTLEARSKREIQLTLFQKGEKQRK